MCAFGGRYIVIIISRKLSQFVAKWSVVIWGKKKKYFISLKNKFEMLAPKVCTQFSVLHHSINARLCVNKIE